MTHNVADIVTVNACVLIFAEFSQSLETRPKLRLKRVELRLRLAYGTRLANGRIRRRMDRR